MWKDDWNGILCAKENDVNMKYQMYEVNLSHHVQDVEITMVSSSRLNATLYLRKSVCMLSKYWDLRDDLLLLLSCVIENSFIYFSAWF